MPDNGVVAAILAAGGGSRYARSGGMSHKLLADLGGVPLVARAVDRVLDAGVGPVIVVTGAADLAGALAGRPVQLVPNERWREGIATSLQAAVGACRDAGADALVVGLADQPGVPASAWRAIGRHVPPPPVAVATYAGRRGNPVFLAAEVWDLLPATGDAGARTLMRERPELVAEIACDGDPRDIDTTEDLDTWS